MSEEIWKECIGHIGYQVSNHGRIRSNARNNGWKILVGKAGRYRVLGWWLPKKTHRKCTMVHRLVAEAFIPNPDKKPQINHKNGICDDNRVENLEWTTQSENMHHMYRVLRKKVGEKCSFSKLSDNDVYDIRALLMFGARRKDIQAIYRVSQPVPQPISNTRPCKLCPAINCCADCRCANACSS